MRDPIRIAIVQPAMAPYRFASFNALAREPGIDLLVVYLRRGGHPYDWATDEALAAFQRVELKVSPAPIKSISCSMIKTLRKFQPDVSIVGGWDEPSYHLIGAVRPFLGRRVVVWAESTPNDWRKTGFAKDFLKRSLVRRTDAVLVPGSAARNYCESLGTTARRYYVAPNAIDNDRFFAGAEAARRVSAGGPKNDGTVFLYVGRLDPEKGVDVLLKSWQRVESATTRSSLLIAGAGSQQSTLKRYVEGAGLRAVQFLGFIPQAELPAVYGKADVFVFPSLSDPWGLVINEAMACGLPVITTSAPGAAADLVRDGVNGRIVPSGDDAALAQVMSELAEDESLRRVMGEASIERIATFSPEGWAKEIREMVNEISE